MKRHFLSDLLFGCLGAVMILGMIGCSGPKRLGPSGIAQLQIGSEMLPTGTTKWRRHAVRDTLYLQGGYSWRASILQYEAGKVYVESDFMGQETINRIRVESPELQLKGGRMVGMQAEQLWLTGSDWQVTFLQGYDLLDAISLYEPSVHFLIRDPKYQPDPAQPLISLDEITPTARVAAIVVM